MSTEATKRQLAVLRAIERGCAAGEPLSLREIGREVGIRNVSAVAKHVNALCKKGLLDPSGRKSRSLRLPGSRRKTSEYVFHVPLFGSIPAGYAQSREQEAEGYVAVDVRSIDIKQTPNTFALRVRGDSMIGKHILPNDIVLVEGGVNPQVGQIVAALIDGDSSLKTFMRKRGKAYLRAENPAYPKLIAVQELMIQGVFRGLIRKCNK